jgi:hypothetical protein
MLAALDAFQDFKRAIVAEFDLVDALELIGNAEALANKLQRDARATRRGLPSAKEQEPFAIEAGQRGNGLSKDGRG